VGEQEVALQAEELPGELAIPADHLAHGDRGVVIRRPGGHAAEEGEGADVGRLEGLGALPRVGADVEAIGEREAHHRERRLALLAGDTDRCVAEVELGLTGWVRERDEHLLVVALVHGDGLLHLGDAAFVAVLIAQTLEDALGRVALLGRSVAVRGQDLLDHAQVGAELGLGARSGRAVARWLRVSEDLLEGLRPDAVVPSDGSLRDALDEHLAPDLRPVLHVGSHSFSRLLALRRRP
jgi:hypothetical protein